MQVLRDTVESPKSYVYERHSSSEHLQWTRTNSETMKLFNSEDLTGYKIVYIRILGDPGSGCKLLKNMVGERGFEPTTPWSRTLKRKTLSALHGVA
jgi:hypothetical protein